MQETQETWVRSLGREDPLEESTATHSSILAGKIPWTVHGVAQSWTRLKRLSTHAQEVWADLEVQVEENTRGL